MSTAQHADVGVATPAHHAPAAIVADPMLPVIERVARVRREDADIWTLEIEPAAGFDFQPGQFNMLYALGVGEAAISISGDPAERGRLTHTIRDVGRVSEALRRLKPGDPIGVRGPYGVGWPVDEAAGADVVIIAGGLGLAPLRPAIYRFFAERPRFGRLVLLVGMRQPDDILFRRELERWRRRLDIDLQVTVDHAGGDWRGSVGVVTTLIPRAAFDPAHTIALICGPEVMMRFAIAGLAALGVPGSAMYVSMERNMKCAIGLCGHCQFGPTFICRDGPVFTYDQLRPIFSLREI
jgi:NAD(P)H-flavin reductase